MRVIFAVLLMSLTFSAYGHGGDDHGAAPPVASLSIAARAVAATEEFEVVAIPDAGKLTIYVDRHDSNEPVVGAKIEIEGAGLKGVANEAAPGLYVMNMPSLAPGKYPLTISIEAGETGDLLTATLDTSSAPGGVAPHVHDWSERLVWRIAGLLTLSSAALFLARRKRKVRGL